MAVNKVGNWISNTKKTDVNAVTWGVFPAMEIIQPTVVDPGSFMVWKDEAFELWSRGWAQLYPESDISRKILEEVSFLSISSSIANSFIPFVVLIIHMEHGYLKKQIETFFMFGAEYFASP